MLPVLEHKMLTLLGTWCGSHGHFPRDESVSLEFPGALKRPRLLLQPRVTVPCICSRAWLEHAVYSRLLP